MIRRAVIRNKARKDALRRERTKDIEWRHTLSIVKHLYKFYE